MADTFESIVFGAEFDAAAFTAGVDKMIAAGKKLQAQADELTQAAEEQGKAFDDNVGKMKKLEQQLDSLQKGEKGNSDEAKRLKGELQALVTANDNLGKAMAKGGAELAKVKTQNDNLQQAYAKTRKVAADFQEQAGKPIKMAINEADVINALQTVKTKFDAAFADAGSLLNINELGQLDKAIIESRGEFEQIVKTVDILREKLLSLEPGTEQFDDVSDAVRSGNEVIKEYTRLYAEASGEVSKSEPKFKSLRSQIAALRNELTRLEEAGEDNTEQYRKTQIEAAKLTDNYSDMQAQIKILSSDTKALDFGVAALQAAAAGYQTIIGAQELFGISTEGTEEAQKKLLAIMNLVQGAQQLENALLKEGTIRTLGANAARQAFIATQKLLTTTLNLSAAAARSWAIAIGATGVLALAAGVAFLVYKLNDTTTAEGQAEQAQKRLNEVMNEGSEEYSRAVKTVNELRLNIQLAREGFLKKKDVVKQYNETIGKTTGEVKNLDEAEKALVKNAKAYIQFTLLKAAANLSLEKAAKLAFEAAQRERKQADDFVTDEAEFGGSPEVAMGLYGKEAQEKQEKQIAAERKKRTEARKKAYVNEKKQEQEEYEAIANDLQKQAAALGKKFGFDFFGGEGGDKASQAVENIFKKELARLNTALRKAIRNGLTSDTTIREDFADELASQLQGVADAVEKKQLTKGQAGILTKKIKQLVRINEKAALEDFHKQLADVQRGLERELEDLTFQDSEKRLEAIYDGFEKEGAAISLALEQQQKDIARQQEDLNARLAEGVAKGTIKPETYERLKKQFAAYFGRLAEDATAEAARRKGELAEKIFQDSLEELNRQIKDVDLLGGEVLQQELTGLTAKYLQGQVSYEDYQKGLTKLQTEYEADRKQRALNGLQAQIDAVKQRLNDPGAGLNQDQRKAEEEQVRQLTQAYQDLNAEILGDKVEKKKAADDQRLQRLQQYVSYAGEIISNIGQAWLTVNEMEERSLERSISLQEQRVAAAQKIAERGNATYLKLEEERLQELQIKQENAARRQMAINAALQASQLLVGITGAIAQISTGGAANVIAGIVTIVGALASGYALVKSLQQNQPSFYEGTDYVEGRRNFTGNTDRVRRLKEPSGRDTIPAWLHEGESVNDVETTAKYSDLIKAMHQGKIPPDFFSRQIAAMYPRSPIPMLATDRMDNALQVKVMESERTNRLLEENTKQLKAMRKEMAASKPRVDINMNRKEIAIGVRDCIVEENLRKKM